MNVPHQSSFSPARRARIACVCALLTAGLLVAPTPAAAQISRVGVTKPVIPGALLFGDVAHDPRNDVYLSVMAWGTVWGAFVNTSGDLIAAFTPGPAVPGGWGNNPRVAYGPDLNGGAGGFLVTWHESGAGPNFVHAAVAAYPGGLVSAGVDISGGAPSYPNAGGPSIAYSPQAKKFLVTWTGDGWSVKARLVNGVTGQPEGAVINVVGPIGVFHPAAAWNPTAQEFGIAYAGHAGYIGLVRVSTAGGVVGATGPFGQAPGTINTVAAVNSAGRYVLGWVADGGARSLELDSTGNPLASFPTLISSHVGTVSSFSFAHNPLSGTILAVGESSATKEVAGVELSSAGLPLGVAVALTDGAGTGRSDGSYAPRVAARQTAKQWSISYSRLNGTYTLANQIVATGSSDPTAGPSPPPPPPPIARTLNDMDGDGRSDAVVWRPATGTWFWPTSTSTTNSNANKQWGTAGDMPLTGDIDGDGVADLVIWRPSIGHWFWLTSSTGYDYGSAGRVQWGASGDVPILADVDGDGKDDLIVWRVASGIWYWLTSRTGYAYASAQALQWGAPGDSPLTGDFDGDGKADFVVWRPSTGIFFWLTSTSGYSYAAARMKQWGSLGDIPFIGEIDGDRRADLVVWRTTTGTWFWLGSSSGYSYAAQGQKQWGSATLGDVPTLADVDGDGRSDLEVWRSMTGEWFWLTSSSGYNYASQGSRRFGIGGDVPILR